MTRRAEAASATRRAEAANVARRAEAAHVTGKAVQEHKAQAAWAPRLSAIREIRVLALVRRRADQDETADRRERYEIAEWEVPVVEVVLHTPLRARRERTVK